MLRFTINRCAAVAAMLLTFTASSAMAQEAVSLTPAAVVVSPANGQQLAIAYSTPAGGTWIYSTNGSSQVYVITGNATAADGSTLLYFDQYTYWAGDRTDTSFWTKQYSGQIVADGTSTYLMQTYDHRAGTHRISNPQRFFIAIEAL